jgi:hypothetical protein
MKSWPDGVPGGMERFFFPERVGTSIVAPSAACGKVIGTSQKRSAPSRTKNGCSFTVSTTYRSPPPPPAGPASPSPRSLRRVPPSTPGGIFTLSARLSRTWPVPAQLPHGSLTTWPVPPQRPHVRRIAKNPCCIVIWPCPLQAPHRSGRVPLRAPVPEQSGHTPVRGTTISFSAPKTASSKVTVRLYRRSAPRRERPPPPPPPNIPPKKSLMMSSTPNPEKSPKPPNPCPVGPAWPKRSYCCRFSGSERTEYASLISLNRSSADLSPGFRSG